MTDDGGWYSVKGLGRTWIEAGLEGGKLAREEERGSSRGAPADLGFALNLPREIDLRVLRALLADDTLEADGGLKEAECSAFGDMLAALTAERRRYDTLSPRQREWVMRRAEDLSIDTGEDPAERNRKVPRGREVESRAAQLGLPLSPPGRVVGKGLDALFEPGPFEREAGGPERSVQASGYMRIESPTMEGAREERAARLGREAPAPAAQGKRRRPAPLGGVK